MNYWRRRFLLFGLLALPLNLSPCAQTIPPDWTSISPPISRSDSPWLISDYLEDGDLLYKSLFHIDFESNGTAWIAGSEGLYRYDGYEWTVFTEKDGLPSRFIRCVLVTRNNTLWVATDRGAGIFDGKTFKTYLSELYLAGPSVRRMIEEPDGTIWFCCDPWPDKTLPGGLTSKKDGIWKTYRVDEGLPSKFVKDFFRDSQNRIFVLTDVGLGMLENGQWTQPLKETGLLGDNINLWDITESPEGELMVSNRDSLLILKENKWTKYPNPLEKNRRITDAYRFCINRKGTIYTCRYIDDEHLAFQAWNGREFQSVSSAYSVLPGSIDYVAEAPDGSIWAVGFNTLHRWDRSGGEWRQMDLPQPVFADGNNRIWFSGEKTVVKDRNQWYQIDYFQGNLALDANQKVWGWSKKGVYHWVDDSTFFYSLQTVGLQTIDTLIVDQSNCAWAAGKDAQDLLGIRSFDYLEWIDRTPPSLQKDSVLLCHPDPQEGVWYLIQSNGTAQKVFYYLLDRQVKQTVPCPPISLETIKDFAIDPVNRDLWIYGAEGVLYYDNYSNKPTNWIRLTGLSDTQVFSMVFRDKNEWLGVLHKPDLAGSIYRLRPGKGGWEQFDYDAKFFGFLDLNGFIYFGGQGALYSIAPKNEIPRILTVPEMKSVHGLAAERNGTLWIQSDNSVFRYQPDGIPPETTIINPIKEVDERETLRFRFSGAERFLPKANRKNYLYSWQINFNPWSVFQTVPQEGLSLVGIKPGRYTLRVRALDEGGNIDLSPQEISFYVRPLSIQDTRWFKAGLVGVFIIISILAMYAFRARKQLAHYAKNLESMVEQRSAALHETETKYLRLFENVPDAIIIWDPETYRINDINNAAIELYGYNRQEFLTLTITDISAEPEKTAQIARFKEPGYKNHIPLRYHKKKDGSVFPTEISHGIFTLNNRPCALAILRDITQRKRNEERLRFHTTILENMSDWVTATDLDFRITYVSPSVKEILGYHPDELIGKTTVEAYGKPEVLSASRKKMLHGIKAGHWQGELINTRRNGQKIIVSLHIGTLRDENGIPTGTVSVARDITSYKQMEEQLFQTQKINAIGQLAGGISHDFNNLLTGIIGNLNMALVRGTDSIRPFLKSAEVAANRAAELVKQLLAFSRKSQIELTLINLNDVIGEVYNLIRHTIDRRIDIEIEKEELLPNVMADKSQVIAALMNLSVNARDAIEEILSGDAMPERRNTDFTILLRTHSVELSEDYCQSHPQARSGRFVCVSVSDNGIGMSSDVQKYIFEPFYTTKEVDKGTGLGLSSVYGTVTQHNGWVELQSRERVGTTFAIFLPVCDNPIQIPTQTAESPLRGGDETILIVDDEEMILSLGKAILEPVGYRVLLALDGEEAVKLVKNQETTIDLVLLDISMPRQTGWEVLQQFQSIRPTMKVVMCSGYSRDELKNTTLKLLPHLPKPYNPDALMRTVRNVLDEV